MRQTIIAAVMLLATSAVAAAQCPTIRTFHGWMRCTERPAIGDGTYVLGFDHGTYSYFSTNIDPRGNMYGIDGHGNYWTYNRRTGTYRYYNTTQW